MILKWASKVLGERFGIGFAEASPRRAAVWQETTVLASSGVYQPKKEKQEKFDF